MSGIQMVGLSGIQIASNTGPFGIKPLFDHLNTKLVRYSYSYYIWILCRVLCCLEFLMNLVWSLVFANLNSFYSLSLKWQMTALLKILQHKFTQQIGTHISDTLNSVSEGSFQVSKSDMALDGLTEGRIQVKRFKVREEVRCFRSWGWNRFCDVIHLLWNLTRHFRVDLRCDDSSLIVIFHRWNFRSWHSYDVINVVVCKICKLYLLIRFWNCAFEGVTSWRHFQSWQERDAAVEHLKYSEHTNIRHSNADIVSVFKIVAKLCDLSTVWIPVWYSDVIWIPYSQWSSFWDIAQKPDRK